MKFYLVGTHGQVIDVFESEWGACQAMPLRVLFRAFPNSGMTSDNTTCKIFQRVWDQGFNDCVICSQWLDPQNGEHLTVYKRES